MAPHTRKSTAQRIFRPLTWSFKKRYGFFFPFAKVLRFEATQQMSPRENWLGCDRELQCNTAEQIYFFTSKKNAN